VTVEDAHRLLLGWIDVVTSWTPDCVPYRCRGCMALELEVEAASLAYDLAVARRCPARASPSWLFRHPSADAAQRAHAATDRGARDEGRGTRDEGRGARDEGRGANGGTRDEGRGTSSHPLAPRPSPLDARLDARCDRP
jgi:hypothetical protein